MKVRYAKLRRWISAFSVFAMTACLIPVPVVSADTENNGFVELSEVPDNIRALLDLGELSPSGNTRTFGTRTAEESPALQIVDTDDLNSIRMESADGQGIAKVFASPIRYETEEGQREFIDTSMAAESLVTSVFTGYSYRNAANDITFQFSKRPHTGIRVDGLFTMAVYSPNNFQLPNGSVDQTPEGDGRMVYPEAFGEHTCLEYININTGLKENIILKENIGKNRFDFVFQSDEYVPVLSDDGRTVQVVHKDNPEDTPYRFTALYVYDSFQPQEYDTIEEEPSQEPVYVGPAAGVLDDAEQNEESGSAPVRHFTEENYYEVTALGGGKYKITSVVSEEFLNSPDTVYPVTIDPSFTGSDSNAQDTFVWRIAGGTTNANYNLDYLRFGRKDGADMISYFRFNSLPTLPNNVNITDARLKFTFRSGQTSGADGVCMIVQDHQWYESSLSWANQPYGEWGYSSSHNNYQYYNFYVRPFVEMWYYGGYPNYGIDFTYGNMINDYNSCVSTEGEAYRAPTLTIIYKVSQNMDISSSYSDTLELGDYHWYRVTASYTGPHVFYTTGSVDTYGELYLSSTRLTTNDDGGTGNNFKITYTLTAGKTYHLKVRGFTYEKTGSYVLKVLPDYTIPINNLLGNAVTQCENHRCMSWSQYCSWCVSISPLIQPSLSEHTSMTLGSFTWFYTQVKPGGIWDIKVTTRWNSALPNVPYLGTKSFIFRGKEINAADMGNIMYGYIGRATGFGKITLFWGGGVAHQGSINNSAVNTPPYYGDLPEDHVKIEEGYNMFVSDHPEYPSTGYDGIPVEEGILAAVADILIGLI